MQIRFREMPTTMKPAEFRYAARLHTWIYDGRDYNLNIQWSRKADSACGWTVVNHRFKLPHMSFLFAARHKRFGMLHVWRIQRDVLNWIYA